MDPEPEKRSKSSVDVDLTNVEDEQVEDIIAEANSRHDGSVGHLSKPYEVEAFKTSSVFIYNFYEIIKDKSEDRKPVFARCLICDPNGNKNPKQNAKVEGIVKYTGATVNNCESHLRAKHPEVQKKYEVLKNFVKRRKEEISREKGTKKARKNDVDDQPIFGRDKEGNLSIFESQKTIDRQKQFDKAVAVCAAEGGVSFRFLGGEAFRTVIAQSGAKVKVKNEKTVSRNVSEVYKEVMEGIVQIVNVLLDEIMGVSFTSDIWTDSKHCPYLSLTLHLILRYEILILLILPTAEKS